MGHSRLRLTYNPDGTIIADYVPGDAYLSYWIEKILPIDTWHQSGVGINLQRNVTFEEADYLERLATCYHETPCPVVGREHIERLAMCYQEMKQLSTPLETIVPIATPLPELIPGDQLSLF